MLSTHGRITQAASLASQLSCLMPWEPQESRWESYDHVLPRAYTPSKSGRIRPSRGVTEGRAVGKTRLSPSQGPYRRPTSLRPMPVRPHGRGLSQAASPAPSGCRPSDTQPHVACMGVETIASRAVISLYQLIQRYGKRHGLHRPREAAVGRADGAHRAGARLFPDTWEYPG